MKLELTEDQQDAVILTILKRDLQNVQESFDDIDRHATYSEEYVKTQKKKHKKHIKMLKRAINFYSVMDEY